MRKITCWFIVAFFAAVIVATTCSAQETKEKRQPRRFAIIFNKGYAGDHLPKDPAEFEKLVKAVKEANFNVILCAYDEKRAAICKKHDMQIFVDLLVPGQHVYNGLEACKKLGESLQ